VTVSVTAAIGYAGGTGTNVTRLARTDIAIESPVRDANTLLIRLRRRTPPAAERSAPAAPVIVPAQGNPGPQRRLIQPPPRAVTWRPGPEHTI
jgi:hypothetical protein